MVIELSNLTFTDQDDVVPASGVEEILNTGVANTLAGNDTITSTGTKFNLLRYLETSGTGFYNIGTLNTSDGNDIIRGIHSPNESEPYPDNPIGLGNIRSYGILNERGTIDTGDGNDRITGISEAQEGSSPHSTFYAYGITSSYGSINTGDGNDTIIGTGTDIGIYIRLYSTLDTGKDNDIITGTGSLLGIENFYSTIDTGDGSDIITGIGTDSGGIYNILGSINTGDGNDIITGTTRRGSGIENFSNSSIDTGDGDDIITGIGTNYGIYNGGTINTGNGNDSIIADGGSDGIGAGWGIYNNGGTINTGNGEDSILSQGKLINYGGAINMGDGNDSIIANEGFESGLNSSGAWFLGDGADYIKGFGSGDFYGGNGFDTLQLTPGTYTVGIWGEGGESPIFTKGNQLMITSEFERLIAGGTTYDFASLTTGQIIVVA